MPRRRPTASSKKRGPALRHLNEKKCAIRRPMSVGLFLSRLRSHRSSHSFVPLRSENYLLPTIGLSIRGRSSARTVPTGGRLGTSGPSHSCHVFLTCASAAVGKKSDAPLNATLLRAHFSWSRGTKPEKSKCSL